MSCPTATRNRRGWARTLSYSRGRHLDHPGAARARAHSQRNAIVPLSPGQRPRSIASLTSRNVASLVASRCCSRSSMPGIVAFLGVWARSRDFGRQAPRRGRSLACACGLGYLAECRRIAAAGVSPSERGSRAPQTWVAGSAVRSRVLGPRCGARARSPGSPAVAAVAVAVVAVVVILSRCGRSYQVKAVFINASQIVTGDQVRSPAIRSAASRASR